VENSLDDNRFLCNQMYHSFLIKYAYCKNNFVCLLFWMIVIVVVKKKRKWKNDEEQRINNNNNNEIRETTSLVPPYPPNAFSGQHPP